MNRGLQLWQRRRVEWLSGSSKARSRPKAVPLSSDQLAQVLADVERVRAFHKPVPLPQMVDILVDMWEAEAFED